MRLFTCTKVERVYVCIVRVHALICALRLESSSYYSVRYRQLQQSGDQCFGPSDSSWSIVVYSEHAALSLIHHINVAFTKTG